MEEQRFDYWFPSKSIGWGWGLPVKWQGWLTLIGYLGMVFAGFLYFKPRRDVVSLFIYLAVITSLLIAVLFMKGQRGRT
jgi:hypothetical protein